MASLNATTSSGIVATADNTGQLQLQSAGTTVMTITSTGVTTQIGAPAFSAVASTTQNISNITWTKVVINTEQFDTANCFDPTTNYRFTPNVAGYYQIQGSVYLQGGASGQFSARVYKNGTAFVIGNFTPASGSDIGGFVSGLVYMNGTTDYVELYVFQNSGSTRTTFGDSASLYTYFQGFLARSA
jgi:hypothetical protein